MLAEASPNLVKSTYLRLSPLKSPANGQVCALRVSLTFCQIESISKLSKSHRSLYFFAI